MWTIFKSLNSKLTLALLTIVVGLGCYVGYQRKVISNLDTVVGYQKNTITQYQDLVSGTNAEKRVLTLKLDELKNSNDSLIQHIQNTTKRLKTAENSLKRASVINTKIDTVFVTDITPIESDTFNCDFTVKFEPNFLTTIVVERAADSLYCKPTILNETVLLNYSKKEYRNKRKNWFDRLFHWDWKKDEIERYELENSNDLINTTDIRVIKITE